VSGDNEITKDGDDNDGIYQSRRMLLEDFAAVEISLVPSHPPCCFTKGKCEFLMGGN
jgi:hypothetical protein